MGEECIAHGFGSQLPCTWNIGGRRADLRQEPHVAIVVQPRPGGRWFGRGAPGHETHWGKVLAWEPPSRLLPGWQINSEWTCDPDFLTKVELTFTPAENGG